MQGYVFGFLIYDVENAMYTDLLQSECSTSFPIKNIIFLFFILSSNAHITHAKVLLVLIMFHLLALFLFHNNIASSTCFAFWQSRLQMSKTSQSFSNAYILQARLEESMILHVKSFFFILASKVVNIVLNNIQHQSCSSLFKRYALLLYAMLSSSLFHEIIKYLIIALFIISLSSCFLQVNQLYLFH